MSTLPRTACLTVLAAALSLTLAACGSSDGTDTAGLPTAEDLGSSDGQPVGDDAPADTPGEEDGTSGGAAGSCLAGEPDCTDESYGGQDVTRPIPLTDTPSDAERIELGTTAGAPGRRVVAAHPRDDTTLELTFEGGACDVLEAVEVIAPAGEVRILVLSGMDASVDACAQQIVQWSTEVQLDAPLGDRALLDLAG